MHAAIDLTGDGKTVLKGGLGGFTHMRHLSPRGGSGESDTKRDGHVSLARLNGNRLFDNGETDLDPNGPDFVSQTIASTGVPNPNERQPISDEFAASLERELSTALRSAPPASIRRTSATIVSPTPSGRQRYTTSR